ncbi:MEGF10 [Branchiostoma lanceolatum]|uniref:MEGF10 protein n=1 Tax=Branchiostoma lanceolatum TaxID=7740 RepID=A0A8J9YVS3_BRALA|nr:MEGF10 [Branchiostoma lanceolatum]
MEGFGGSGARQGQRALGVLGLVVCMATVVTGLVDVTIVSKYQFYDESADTWLYCYYTGSLITNGYQFGVEVDTGSGTGFTRQRGSGSVTGGKSVRILDNAGDFRVGAFSCEVRDGSQTEKTITFKMKSQADVWPASFTVTANTGDPVTLQMVQKSSRTGILDWRKGGVGGTVLTGQNGLNITIASVQSSDEGIYECYNQGDTDRKQGIMRLIVRGCAKNKWGPPSCTGDCPVCYNGGVCDDNTGECVCPPGFHGHNCESACANNKIGTSCTRECEGGDCTGQLLCVMDPYGCSCAPGLMGIECNTGEYCYDTRECEGGDCTGQLLCVMDPYGCSCAPGLMGIECNTGEYCYDTRECEGGDCTGQLLCVMDPYGCSCAPGLMGIECNTGEYCYDTRECEGGDCTGQLLCVMDPYGCSCAPGLMGIQCNTGEYCYDTRECEGGDCTGQLLCVMDPYGCSCAPGRMGIECNTGQLLCVMDPYGCSCAPGLMGIQCNTGEYCYDTRECEGGDCTGQLLCVMDPYGCSCAPGLMGIQCNTGEYCYDTRECEGGDCTGQLLCVMDPYGCSCAPGLMGIQCNTGEYCYDTRECEGGDCTGQLLCVMDPYGCSCAPGRMGIECNTECEGGDCTGQLLCVMDPYGCSCAPGLMGIQCNTGEYCYDTRECEGGDCTGQLLCVMDPYGCSCAPGLMGIQCNTECEGGDCTGQLLCVMDPYGCSCAPELMGIECNTGEYCYDTRECEGGDCTGQLLCVMDPYGCSCAPGLMGIECNTGEYCYDTRECEGGDCTGQLLCVMDPYGCSCAPGLMGIECNTGEYCYDTRECEGGDCTGQLLCVMDPYGCSCAPGLMGVECNTGEYCYDTRECEGGDCTGQLLCVMYPYGCSCAPGLMGIECNTGQLLCVMDPYGCSCAPGLMGIECNTGEYCYDTRECEGGDCTGQLLCVMDPYGCSCAPGLMGIECNTGEYCYDTRECEGGDCTGQLLCVMDPYGCSCAPGLMGIQCNTGEYCYDTRECEGGDCTGQLLCVMDPYGCSCAPGLMGVECNTGEYCYDTRECEGGDCTGQLLCVMDPYGCSCAPGLMGIECNTGEYCYDTRECEGGDCTGQLLCVMDPYGCSCAPGLMGIECNTGEYCYDTRECEGGDCTGQLLCVMDPYGCSCAPGLMGIECNTGEYCYDTRECEGGDCTGQLLCVMDPYGCSCAPGLMGIECNTGQLLCVMDPYGCSCAPGLMGIECNTGEYCYDTRECEGGDCTGQLLCVMDPYGCSCAPGLMGIECNTGKYCYDTRECEGGDCTGQLLCVMDPYGCSCAPGLMGIECNTVCSDGMYGAGCTQTCHCANGPAACNKKTGACTGGCLDFWTGDSSTVSYGGLFTREEGHFFGDVPEHIEAYDNIDVDECARRCLQGYGSYDGVTPPCLSFNHRPAGSPEGGSARCWLSSSDKDRAVSPGPEWDSWSYRNYYQMKDILAPQDCADIVAIGIRNSHVYTIGHPQPFQAYCDMDTDGGGWTVIQRRQDGSVPFDKTWTEYEQGFGNLIGEYWLGLENIHSLTTQKQNELYVNLEDWEQNTRYAKYSTFSVGDASSKYTATIGGYSGDATDSLDPSDTRHSINNRQFSTTDQDNDGVSTDCAGTFGQGGWWYTPSCGWALLNGQYLTGCSVPAPVCSPGEFGPDCTGTCHCASGDSVCDVMTGVCSSGRCDAGWKGSNCQTVCTPGKFGPDCTGACHCVSGDSVCDVMTGVCSSGGCEAGWKGNNCQTACTPGEFGPDCTSTCHCASGGSVCDVMTGVCSSGGCGPGFKGSNCQIACTDGEFGPGCSFTCHCASGDSVCDVMTGVCSSGGCQAGWEGNNCQDACAPGEFGPDCTGTCRCASGDSVCDVMTGVCSSGGCQAGWEGNNCQDACAPGKFGPDCTGTCRCASGDSVCDVMTGVCSSGGCQAGWEGNNCQDACAPGKFGPDCTGTCRCASGDSVCDVMTGVCSSGGCQAGWEGNNCQDACAPGKFGPDCTGTCRCASGDSVCDVMTGVCSSGGCQAGWEGNNCQTVCSPGEFGPDCTGTCHCASGSSVCDIRTGVCSSGGCEAGWKGSDCQTECPDGLYGADCTQTCHCANGPTACDRKTGVCAGMCVDFWTGNSCHIRTATVSYVDLFTKEDGRFFGDSPEHITAYDNIDADECARRCLQGYGSYDGVTPPCLSFNHRPAGSPEGASARCWLRSSDKDTAVSSGSEWTGWPYRNYYQRKHILAPQDCTDMFALGIQYSHVYTIGHPQPFQAYCDMDTDGGGWTVIQRRQDGSVPFDKTWTEYEQGFGNLIGEYWLGLGKIHSLTTQKQNELYVYLEDWEMNSRFARYSTFSVGDAGNKYTATVSGYNSTSTADNDLVPASKASQRINNVKFSTKDQDNDVNSAHCTVLYGQGGWWNPYSCGWALLNGQYLTGCSVPAPGTCSSANGIVWYSWKGYTYSLKKTVMMIRPTDFQVSLFQPCQNGGNLTSGPEYSGLYICACADGWYGAYCHKGCGHCYHGQACDKFDGTCPTGGDHICEAGYNGTKCDQECYDGYYGHDCLESCGNCAVGEVCEKTDGRCSRCEDLWVGYNCKKIPATVSGHPESFTVVVGNEVTFRCTGRGVPVPDVVWHHDDDVITPGDGISIDVTEGGLVGQQQHVIHSTLTIKSARRLDNGQYVCVLSNVAGNDTSQEATLVVQEHPDDVTVIVTAVNSTTLLVTWAVGVTGNLDIIDSQVRYKRSDTADWGVWGSAGVSAVNGEYYIYDLQPAFMYDVEVRVNNSLGWSGPGNRTGTTAEAPPGPPSNLQAAPDSHSSVHLTWAPPIEPNGEIISYTVQYGPSESCNETELPQEVTTTDGGTTTVIEDLDPYTNYTFRVRGATRAGEGDFSYCTSIRTLQYYPTAPVIQTFADQHDCNCRTPNIPRPVQLHVAWRRPDHIHGQLQAYRVSLYNSTGGEPFYQENMTSGLQQENLTAVVTSSHLQPAHNYSVIISAINTVYRGNESISYEARTSDGCPDAPIVTRMANSECGVSWTAPTETRGRLTGYNVTYTDTPLHNPDESEPGVRYDTLGLDQHQWSKSLDDLPANSRVRVAVRALTCAEGDKGEEFTCQVSRVEPPPPPVIPTGPPPIPSTRSFPMVLPEVSERNGPIRCCQIIVVTMNEDESLADLKTRVGEPEVMLTEDAPEDGKTQPYVALSLSTVQYKSTDKVRIGEGGPCGHQWCCERSELADPRLAKTSGNRELRSGEKYTAAVRCYVDSGARRRKRETEKLFTTSGYIDPVITVFEEADPIYVML